MGPAEAVKAHIDLGTPLSIAAHFQVFRLGIEGFDDAVNVLVASLKEHNLKPDTFVAPVFGQAIKIPAMLNVSLSRVFEENFIEGKLFDRCAPQKGLAEKIASLTGMLSTQSHVSPEQVVW